MFEKLKTKLFLVPALGGAMTLGSSLVAFAAQTGGRDKKQFCFQSFKHLKTSFTRNSPYKALSIKVL